MLADPGNPVTVQLVSTHNGLPADHCRGVLRREKNGLQFQHRSGRRRSVRELRNHSRLLCLRVWRCHRSRRRLTRSGSWGRSCGSGFRNRIRSSQRLLTGPPLPDLPRKKNAEQRSQNKNNRWGQPNSPWSGLFGRNRSQLSWAVQRCRIIPLRRFRALQRFVDLAHAWMFPSSSRIALPTVGKSILRRCRT